MLYQFPTSVHASSHGEGAPGAVSWGGSPPPAFHSGKARGGAGGGGSSEDWGVNFQCNLSFLLKD